MAGSASKLRAFSVFTMVCANSAAEAGGVAGVEVGHGSGGVGTGTISERELLFSSLSATVLVASTMCGNRIAVTGEEKDRRFPDPQRIYRLVHVIDPDHKTACRSLPIILDPHSHAHWIARRETACVLQFDVHLR